MNLIQLYREIGVKWRSTMKFYLLSESTGSDILKRGRLEQLMNNLGCWFQVWDSVGVVPEKHVRFLTLRENLSGLMIESLAYFIFGIVTIKTNRPSLI